MRYAYLQVLLLQPGVVYVGLGALEGSLLAGIPHLVDRCCNSGRGMEWSMQLGPCPQ